MKNLNKFIFTSYAFISFLLLTTSNTASASYGNIKENSSTKIGINNTFIMAEKENVSPDKTWFIKFSDPIDSSCLKDSSTYIWKISYYKLFYKLVYITYKTIHIFRTIIAVICSFNKFKHGLSRDYIF